MIRGFYIAGSGMVTQSRKLDIIGNNMSNSRTAGYKNDQAVISTFDDRILGGNLGTVSLGQTIDSVSTNFSQGAIEESGNPFDLAIGGEGFFTLEQSDGSKLYTRNGKFSLDAQGYITDSSGGKLMGENGAINTGGKLFNVSSDGSVSVDGKAVDKLAIYNPVNTGNMAKQASGSFADTAGTAQKTFTGQIKQGATEASNADMIKEMMEMMSSQRSFQACSQVVKMIDSTLARMN